MAGARPLGVKVKVAHYRILLRMVSTAGLTLAAIGSMDAAFSTPAPPRKYMKIIYYAGHSYAAN
jgi:hypothetical protein